jgi:hypothetical protein
MQDSTSAKSLIVQLSSLVNYIGKIAGGSATINDLEQMSVVNGVLKDCVIIQKNLKLKKIKQSTLEGMESYISDVDFQRLAAYLDNLTPSVNVAQQRVSRLIGAVDREGKIDAKSLQENVFAVFETLKNRLNESGPDATELQDLTLQSAEATCEVIRRFIAQEQKRIES